MTVYAFVNTYGGIPQGVELFNTHEEAEEAFERVTDISWKAWEEYLENPSKIGVLDEDFDGCTIFVLDEYKLVPGYDHTVHSKPLTRYEKDRLRYLRHHEKSPPHRGGLDDAERIELKNLILREDIE